MANYGFFKGRMKKTRYLGSACSGTDGTANRTLTHTKALGNDSFISVGGRFFHLTDDYTVSGAVVTFLGIIDNTDIIQVMA